MRIERVTVYFCDLKVDMCYSYGRVTSQPFVFVKLDGDGISGYGECVSLQRDQAVQCAKAVVGGRVDLLESNLPTWIDAKEFRSVREGFSIAMYDLAGRKDSKSVANLLGGRKRDVVPGIPVILVTDLVDVAEKLRRFINDGFKHIKLKFSGDFAGDLELLREVRRLTGDDFTICADSNLGYKTLADAVEAAKAFEEYDLSIWEDPLAGELNEYAQLRETTTIAIMVDEYARSLYDLKNVLENKAADIINLHPNQQGGLCLALKMKDLADGHNIPVSVGGCGLLGISTAAFQSLSSVIGLEYPCGDLGGYYDHGIDICLTRNPYPIRDGCITIPDGVGLGVDVDLGKLEAISQDKVVIT
jgi:L-alanine-DL-glutamate epimerase-like enolase superfamily enzyme